MPLKRKSIGRCSFGTRPTAARAASATSASAPGSPSRPAYMTAARASRYVSRASVVVEGLELLGGAEQLRRGVDRAGAHRYHLRGCGRTPSGRATEPPGRVGGRTMARVRLSQGARMPPQAPPRPVWPARPRAPWHRVGPGPMSKRSRAPRNAAAAAIPPLLWARPAEASSSAATASSGPAAALAACHARRSGSDCGSVASANARWMALRSVRSAARYAAERINGW